MNRLNAPMHRILGALCVEYDRTHHAAAWQTAAWVGSRPIWEPPDNGYPKLP